MIFLKLFFIFSYIGLFNFGGGYAMLSFIQQEVVQEEGWLTESEFTDIVAISQSTPGPIGINCATYTGYTAVVNDGYPWWMGIIGSLLASISILWLPFIVMIMVSKVLLHYKDHLITKNIFQVLRPAIIGLLASAALALMNTANFGSPLQDPIQFAVSILMFAVVFAGMFLRKFNIIYATFTCGCIGIILYGFLGL